MDEENCLGWGTTKDTKPTKREGSGPGPAKHAKHAKGTSRMMAAMAIGVQAGVPFACLACLAGIRSGQPPLVFVPFEPFVVCQFRVHGGCGAGVAGDSRCGGRWGYVVGTSPPRREARHNARPWNPQTHGVWG
jgi:hypothetical protein